MRKIMLTAFGLSAMMFFSCSSDKGKSQETPEASEPEKVAEVVEEAPSVFFKHPADGATVPSPVYIEMGVKGMQVEPAGTVREGYGHHHILVNMKSWPKGEVIPASDSTIHFGKGQTDTTLELEPGEYTLSLQFADGVHSSYGEEMAASITVKVE
jgi:hypothetical protein